MSSYQSQLKAAVHLNNTGVSLLQRRCYRQAMETFGDALSTMKGASNHQHSSTAASSSEMQAFVLQSKDDSAADLQSRLKAAAQRLSKPKASEVRHTDKISLRVLSDDEIPHAIDPPEELGTDSLEGCTSSLTGKPYVAYLVQMELVEFEFPSSRDLDVESSIILYNYGLAYRCLASLSTSVAFCRQLEAGALHLFRLAYGPLSTHRHERDNCISTQQNRLLLVSQLVLGHLVNLSHNRECDHKEYLHRLCHVQQMIRERSALESKLSTPAARAA